MWARLGIMVVTWCAGLGWIHNRCMMGLVVGKCIKVWDVVRPACDGNVSIRQQTLVRGQARYPVMISPHSRNIGSKKKAKLPHGTAITNAVATLPIITSSMTPAKIQLSTEG